MRWSSELKPSKTLTFSNSIAFFNNWNTAWDFNHSDFNDCDPTNWLILGIYNENMPCGSASKKNLWIHIIALLLGVHVWILEKIKSVYLIWFFNYSWNRRMPVMIAPRTQETLIYSSTNKGIVDDFFYSWFLSLKYIIEGVRALFQPKFIWSLYIYCRQTQGS